MLTHYRVRGLEIENYLTDLPIKKGLSSSAAVCVMVARAFNRIYDLKMTVRETRPISKEKRWRIAETLVRGNVADIAPREIGAPEEALLHTERPEATAPVTNDAVPDTSEEGAAVVETIIAGEPVDVVTETPAEGVATDEAEGDSKE